MQSLLASSKAPSYPKVSLLEKRSPTNSDCITLFSEPQFEEAPSNNYYLKSSSSFYDGNAKMKVKIETKEGEYRDHLIKKEIDENLLSLEDSLFNSKKMSLGLSSKPELCSIIFEIYRIFRHNPIYQQRLRSYKNSNISQTGKDVRVSLKYLTIASTYLYIKSTINEGNFIIDFD